MGPPSKGLRGKVHAARQVLVSGAPCIDQDGWLSKRRGWAEVASRDQSCQGCLCIIRACPARRVIYSAVSHGACTACLVRGHRVGMKPRVASRVQLVECNKSSIETPFMREWRKNFEQEGVVFCLFYPVNVS